MTSPRRSHGGAKCCPADAPDLSADDFRSWQETVHLLRSPANAVRPMAAVAEDKAAEKGIVIIKARYPY